MGQLHPVLSNTHVIQNALQAWQHQIRIRQNMLSNVLLSNYFKL